MSKKNLFYSNNAPEIHIFNLVLVLVPKKLQDSTLLFESNSKDRGFSKLIPQLKTLPSLFEVKDNDTIIMNTIINKLQHISRNRGFLISEVGKIIRFFLLSQVKSQMQ